LKLRFLASGNQTVMSGRISIAFVDFAEFWYSFGSIRCVSIASFLVRNWCGVQEAKIERHTPPWTC
jgi:hypothetical protein